MDRVDYQSLMVQDIWNLDKSGELNYSPWYQRRSVWTTPQKSYLINTLIEQKPIPAIYVRYSLDLDRGKTVREVVDGQQRIRAILGFCRNEFSVKHSENGARQTFSQLSRTQRETFLLTAIPVGYLLGATDPDVIDIFGRINSVSKSLNAQEKRNSEFSGEFKQFCLRQASSRVELWRTYNIFTANDISRMNEVQFISDLALNLLEGLSDFSPTRLKNIYRKFDEDFPYQADMAQRMDRLFDFIADIEPSVIRDTIFSRQPIFFSLLLVMDSMKKLEVPKVVNSLHEIDARYHQDSEYQTDDDKQFVIASTATTQRIRQRTIRDAYIRRFLT
jgi:hypothetical protein